MLDPSAALPYVPRFIRRHEYEQMVAAGLFEDERVELLDGVILTMSPHGPEHDSAIERLNEVLTRALVPRATVRVQSAFAAGDGSMPEPDLAIVPRKDWSKSHPGEAFVIIEVAQSSLAKVVARRPASTPRAASPSTGSSTSSTTPMRSAG